MSTLRDDIVKVAFDNPGEVRDALLPILAKTARGKWMSAQQLPQSSIGIPMDREEAVQGWQGFLKASLTLLGRRHPAYKYKVKLTKEGSDKYVAHISAFPAKFEDDLKRGLNSSLTRRSDPTSLEAVMWIEDGDLDFSGPNFDIDMKKNFGRAASVYITGFTGDLNRRRAEWRGAFPDPMKAWRWVD